MGLPTFDPGRRQSVAARRGTRCILWEATSPIHRSLWSGTPAMKLIEADAEGPSLAPETVTPPRPEKRRVSISLLFTLAVLIGTVVAIYTILPARDNVLMSEAVAAHRRDAKTFDLIAPAPAELQAWAIGAIGKDAPQMALPGAVPVAAGVIEIHRRNAALVKYRVGNDEITVLIQHAKGWAPKSNERDDGDLHASLKLVGHWSIVAVGAKATLAAWTPAFAALGTAK